MYGDGLIYKETVGKYTYWAVLKAARKTAALFG